MKLGNPAKHLALGNNRCVRRREKGGQVTNFTPPAHGEVQGEANNCGQKKSTSDAVEALQNLWAAIQLAPQMATLLG
ncbi:hypothetical protein N9Z67_01775 [Rhodopirellula sp.]|mgnify:CR=1 FL=1|nr:hypothetical protein [Rhodopirellula sp.]